jgi:protease-4
MSRRRLPCLLALTFFITLPARGEDKPAEKKVEEKKTPATLAHVRLSGSFDEGPVPDDPLFGALGESFKTKLDRIRKAKDDASVVALILHFDDVGAGWGKLDELRNAIADFRKSGKKAYAFLDAGDSHDYLAAVACDRIFMPESGTLMLTGIRTEVMFYKDLFDKIGVKADMLQMGDFKGAAEPYTRNSLSKENRQQLESVLDDYYEHSLVGAIVAGRPDKKWTAEQVKQLIDKGPFTAKAARAAGLVDSLAYASELRDAINKDLKAKDLEVTKNYGKDESEKLDFSSMFDIFKLFSPPKKKSASKGPKIAVVYATGIITTGKGGKSFLGGEICGSTTMVEAIRHAEQDKTVKAIVLRVDSPGGSALASDLIWNELRRCKKPVIASMSDVAASGGYYISMAARKIYAEPSTLTGSIGVVGGKIVIGGAENKLSLKTEVISRGAHANLLSSESPFSDSEKAAWKAVMQDIYDQFLDKTLEGRKKAGKELTRDGLLKLAGGRIWTGRQAKANGLVDELGTLDDAIAAAKEMGGLDKDAKTELLLLPRPRTILDMLLEGKLDSHAVLSMSLPPELLSKLRGLDALLHLRREMVWAVMPYRVEVR